MLGARRREAWSSARSTGALEFQVDQRTVASIYRHTSVERHRLPALYVTRMRSARVLFCRPSGVTFGNPNNNPYDFVSGRGQGVIKPMWIKSCSIRNITIDEFMVWWLLLAIVSQCHPFRNSCIPRKVNLSGVLFFVLKWCAFEHK